MKSKKLFGALLLSICGTAFAGPVTTANLVQNGSFEATKVNNGGWGVFNTIPGWNVGPLGIELRNNATGFAKDGLNFAELDTTANSYITQDILGAAGLTGGWFTLSFWYSDRPNTAANTNGLTFGFGNDMRTIAGTGNNTSSHHWNKYQSDFYLTRAEILKIEAKGKADSYGMSIDNIVVTQKKPEPAGIGQVGQALAAASYAKRRQARREADFI